MDYRSLRYFVILYETRSFADAAESIPMTVQGLRKSIRLLEDELRVPLYLRGQEQLSFTKAGDLFFQFCMTELEQYREMLSIMNALRQSRRAELNIAFSAGSYALFVPQFPERMHDSLDGEKLSYVTKPDFEIEKGLKAGHYDFGITWGNPDPEFFAYEPIAEPPLCIMVSKKNALSKETHIPISRLRSEKIIFYEAKIQPFQIIEKAFLSRGVEPNFSYIANESEVMLRYLKENMGVGFAHPNSMALYDKSLFHIIRIDDVNIPLGASYLKQHRITAEEKRVIDLLKQIAEENIQS